MQTALNLSSYSAAFSAKVYVVYYKNDSSSHWYSPSVRGFVSVGPARKQVPSSIWSCRRCPGWCEAVKIKLRKGLACHAFFFKYQLLSFQAALLQIIKTGIILLQISCILYHLVSFLTINTFVHCFWILPVGLCWVPPNQKIFSSFIGQFLLYMQLTLVWLHSQACCHFRVALCCYLLPGRRVNEFY